MREDTSAALEGSQSVLAAISAAPRAVRIPSTLPPPPAVPVFDPTPTNLAGSLDDAALELIAATEACDAAYLEERDRRHALQLAVQELDKQRTRLARAKHAMCEAVIARRERR